MTIVISRRYSRKYLVIPFFIIEIQAHHTPKRNIHTQQFFYMSFIYFVSHTFVTKYIQLLSIRALIVPHTCSLYILLYVSRYTPSLNGMPLSIRAACLTPPVILCFIYYADSYFRIMSRAYQIRWSQRFIYRRYRRSTSVSRNRQTYHPTRFHRHTSHMFCNALGMYSHQRLHPHILYSEYSIHHLLLYYMGYPAQRISQNLLRIHRK